MPFVSGRHLSIRTVGALTVATAALVGLTACGGAANPAGSPSASASSAPETTSDAPSGGSGGSGDSGGGGSTTTPVPSGPATCRSSELSVTLGPSEGAAGTVYRAVRFTNSSTRPCVLRGFPGVSYVGGDNGAQVGPAAERDGGAGTSVTIAPGAVASSQLAMVNVGNYDPAACRPTPVKGLRVYPPGETASLFAPAPGTGCAATPPGPQLRVQAVVPGPGKG